MFEASNMLGGMLHVELQVQQPGLPVFPLLRDPPRPKGIHAPTLMSVIGVIAGYAAQCAAADAILRKLRPRNPTSLFKIGCSDGSVLYFGDEINRHLVLDPQSTHALSGFLAGAVVHSGYAPDQCPDYHEIMRHVSAVACTAAYNDVRAPQEHRPAWNITQILKVIWPKARMVLEFRMAGYENRTPIDVQHWPVVASIVAQRHITMAKDVIPPPVAMAIILESAVRASKVRLAGPEASLLQKRDAELFTPGQQ